MEHHSFLIFSGIWLGQGTIEISESSEKLEYYTRWNIAEATSGVIFCTQEVEIRGISNKNINYYTFSEVTASSFSVELDSANVGKISGKGLIKDDLIAWELFGPSEYCEGFEIFLKVSSEKYTTRAEFGSDDLSNTVISGILWKQGLLET